MGLRRNYRHLAITLALGSLFAAGCDPSGNPSPPDTSSSIPDPSLNEGIPNGAAASASPARASRGTGPRVASAQTAPPLRIIAPSPGQLTGPYTVLSFSWQGDPGASFNCWVDGEPYTPCVPGRGIDLVELQHGMHSAEIRANGARAGATVASLQWQVDAQAPSVTFLSPTADQETSASGIVRFGISEKARAFCVLDDSGNGGTAVHCDPSTGFAFQRLAMGPHTLMVFVSDEFGNESFARLRWFVRK